jgi:hypothetical protein
MKRADLASHCVIFLGGDRRQPTRNVLAWKRIPTCPFSLGFFEPKRKGLLSLRPKSTAAPTVRTVWVTPDSDIYSVPLPPATRDSPRVSGVARSSWMLLQRCGRWYIHGPVDLMLGSPPNRYGLNCQNASLSASWITRGLTAVLLMTPNVGEVKLVSGLANWG